MPKLEKDFAEPYAAWKSAPGPETAAGLLGSLSPVLDRGLRAFAPDAGPSARGHAKRIVLDALPKYDATSGPLAPFLMSHLQGLRRMTAESSQPVRAPERMRLQHAALTRAAADVYEETGRDPTDSELADRLGLPHHRIAAVRKAVVQPFNTGFLESTDPEGSGPAVDGRDELAQKFVYHGLSPDDQLILEHTLGWNGKPVLSNQEIARKLRISPPAISQRKSRIQAAIDSAKTSLPR